MPAANLPAASEQLREIYLARERKRKIEMTVVGLLWLVGCPILCALPSTTTGSLWGTSDEKLCGLTAYSVSASMTGHYPKIFGSITATLFAVLVVQRTNNGLCPILKLGWLSRFSPLVATNDVMQQGDSSRMLARDLWKRLEQIEIFGYMAASFLVCLVIFDSKYFPTTHCNLALVSFMSLHRQNFLVGTLGIDYPQLFPTWTTRHGKHLFFLGIIHMLVFLLAMIVLGTVHDTRGCEDLIEFTESLSTKVFNNPDTLRWLASVAVWYNEYAFGFITIYAQLLEHYELQLWEFVGATGMPYVAILSRFSIFPGILRLFSQRNLEIDLFLEGDMNNPKETTKEKEKKS